MTNDQKKGLKSIIMGGALVIFFIGAITNAYETTLGLIIALAIWILAGPLLKVMGLEPVKETKEQSTNSEGEDKPADKPSSSNAWWKTIVLIIVAAIVLMWGASFVFGRGSGNSVSEDREVTDFNKVSISGTGNLYIDQSGEEDLRIEADDNLIDRIETKVVDDTLEIRIKSEFFLWSFWPKSDVNYYLSVDDLEYVNVSGSGKIISESLTADDFEIKISGSGDVDMTLAVQDLKSSVSGSGNFQLDGTADSQDINISGSGKYWAKDLESQKASITISGSGKSEINASEELDVDISGSGSVEYIGSPSIDQSISGSGDISQYDVTDDEDEDSEVEDTKENDDEEDENSNEESEEVSEETINENTNPKTTETE